MKCRLALCAVLTLLASCFLQRRTLPTLPSDSEAEIWNDVLVITKPYCKCYKSPGDTNYIVGYVRENTIFPVNERKMMIGDGDVPVIWYKVSDGWISQHNVQIFSSAAIATAVIEMRHQGQK